MGIGGSVLLLAIGAVLTFAVTLDATPIGGMTVEWDTVGVILMVAGFIGLLWSIYMMNAWRERRGVTPVDTVVERDTYIER